MSSPRSLSLLRQLYAPSLAAMAATAAVRLRGRFRGSSFVQLKVQAGPMESNDGRMEEVQLETWGDGGRDMVEDVPSSH